jgi:3-hydroxyisobutyrate dehydrogenase-like beta-hydroxyacid dehydrogenase
MGQAVAANLLKAGVQTIVWNRSSEPTRRLVAQGAIEAGSVAEAMHCSVALSLLFDDAAVRSVFSGDVLDSVPAGTIHACMSTISTGLAEELMETHAIRGLHYVAAPMFGRPEAAAAGKLNIATAGAAAALDRLEPIFGVLGKAWRMGEDPRLGHVAKLAGNLMIGCAIEAMAEGAALISQRRGDPSPFLSMMGETMFAAPVYRVYGGAIASGTSPGAPSGLQLPLKDVRLMLDEAAGTGRELPMAQLMQNRMQNAVRLGLGEEDWSIALSKSARTPLDF